MEAAFYFIDVGITVLMLYWALKMSKRKPGTPITGFFAYRERPLSAADKAAAKIKQRAMPAQRAPR